MDVIKEVNISYEKYKNDEKGFWSWLMDFTYNNEILLVKLNKNWTLPRSRYWIWYKDELMEFFDLINKDFKKVDDEKFALHANRCKDKIKPKNGTLFFTIESFGDTYFSYIK